MESNGATIFYGNHQSAASISACAQELDARIRQIVAETGCEKVNVIAHSKGGLDVRYALSELGTDKYVASLTTINTPHRGCEFADYLLNIVPEKEQRGVARAYNAVFKKLGDDSPDFLLGVKNLTASACKALNDKLHDAKDVLYQSVGSRQNVAGNGRFPLNYTYRLVKYFDGANDGLVGENSFPWGNSFEYLTVEGKRGISHGDVIDLNRENIPGFDVREFYVKLVHDLKNKRLLTRRAVGKRKGSSAAMGTEKKRTTRDGSNRNRRPSAGKKGAEKKRGRMTLNQFILLTAVIIGLILVLIINGIMRRPISESGADK